MSFVTDLSFNDQLLQEQEALANPAAGPAEPGFWDGGMNAIGEGLARGGFEAAAAVESGFNNLWISGLEAASDLLLPEPRGGGRPDVAFAERERLQDQAMANAEMIKSLRPSPETTGIAGQVLGELSAVVPRTIAGFAAAGPFGGAFAAGAPAGYSGAVIAESEGVDPATAAAKGAIDAATYGIGALIPAARIFGNVGVDAAATVGANVGLGIASRGGTSALLESQGYKQQAQQYRALDGTGLLIDAVLGGAFWGIGRGLGRGQASPETIDAALASNNGTHAQHGSAPGAPVDPASSTAHQNALDLAIQQMARGEPVNVGGLLDDAVFVRSDRIGPDDAVVRRQAEQEVFGEARAELEPIAAAGLPNVRDLRAERAELGRTVDGLDRQHTAVGDSFRDTAKAFQRERMSRKQAERAARDSIAQQRQEIDQQRLGVQARIGEINRALEGNRAAERAGAELAAMARGEVPARLEGNVQQRADQMSSAFKRTALASSVAPDHGLALNRLAGQEIQRLLREGGHPIDDADIQVPARDIDQPPVTPPSRSETARPETGSPRSESETAAVRTDEVPPPTDEAQPAPSAPRISEESSPGSDPLTGIDAELPALVDSIVSGERDIQLPTGAIDADGNPVTVSARELLAEADADIARANTDSKGFLAAALCSLRFGN
ncbi:hypothetical protein IRZ59_22005 [Pseudomonas guariconensis]|uniref:hypothetical protein n=1 Tax=Pseudomonas guariconensis TaxID=1288410 RepID=UPI0018AC491F|nr:hypothetical protein [Pseudomonas guariconensis]MBF8733108.1 hypothetical protein [Pseudomonas guariconensis]